jgi:hypothetical protein
MSRKEPLNRHGHALWFRQVNLFGDSISLSGTQDRFQSGIRRAAFVGQDWKR